MSFISQNQLKLIKKLVTLTVLVSVFLCSSLQASTASLKKLKKGKMNTASGKTLHLYLALHEDEQTQGLSEVLPQELKDNEGMIFVYKTDEIRRFWMPNTFIDLDIFFLDAKFKVLSISRNTPSHPGWDEFPIPIARTQNVLCRHILELKSSSPLAKEIKEGNTLKWASAFSLLETK